MIEQSLFNILGISILGTMISHSFEPIQPVKRKFIQLFPPFISSHLGKLLYCGRCLSFWIALIIYVDLIPSAVAGLLGYLIQHLEDRINHWYE